MHRKAQDYLDDCKDRYNFVSRVGGIASETLKRAMKKYVNIVNNVPKIY